MKRLSDQTLYEILEVPVDAPIEEIARAYARASALYGPGSLATYSLVSDDEARLLNNRIEEARSVLLDPVARAGYDERIGVRVPAVATAQPPAVPMAPATTPWPPPAPVKVAPPILLERPAAPAEPPATRPEPAAESPAAPVPPVQLPLPAAGAPAAGEASAAAEAPPSATPLPTATPLPASMPAVAVPLAASPILLRRELQAQREVVIPEGAAWTGEMLRQVREARGLTTAVLSDKTKVIRYHIENIEADRYGTLPAPVYLRGILMSLARELRLDGQKVARSYLDRMAAEVGPAPRK